YRARQLEDALESLQVAVHLEPDSQQIRHDIESLLQQKKDSLEAVRRNRLKRLEDEGKTVAGYGATAKSTTIMNYCGITAELISYISDTTPAKQEKHTPGTHIPVVAPGVFSASYPDYTVLFAWNHFNEINTKEQAYREHGGKWIIPVKMVQVL
ncbi:MAG: SAM-dependent methyltransferase, partial [Gammaproteobacteria bacterium]|nr:SAM-dependent methyltransferase [Gammaproteobacteria bacterium]